MPFRPPNFSPVIPLSTRAAASKTLAGVLRRFGDRKDREKQQRQELIAALELQSMKQQNAVALSRLQSQFRTEEDVAQFQREAPGRAQKIETERIEREQSTKKARLDRLQKLHGVFDLTESQQQDVVEGRTIRGTKKRKPFRPLRPLAGDKEKGKSLGGRTIAQLVDDLNASKPVAVRDQEGKLTGNREFATPEHERTFNFTKNMLEMEKAGLNDKVLEELKISPDEAISQYTDLKEAFNKPTFVGPPDKPFGQKEVRPLTKPQIVKLIKAGVTLNQISNAMVVLRQRPEYARFSNERLLKLILKSIE